MTTSGAKPRAKAVGKKISSAGAATSARFPTRPLSLADAEMKGKVRELRRQVTHSPESASKFLRSIGMLTPKGRLSKTYGG